MSIIREDALHAMGSVQAGAGTLRGGSEGVQSLVKNGVGDWTVTFVEPLPLAERCQSGNVRNALAPLILTFANTGSDSTVRMLVWDTAGVLQDSDFDFKFNRLKRA